MPPILQMPTTNFFPNRYGLKPSWLILHGTAGGGTAQNVATYFQSTQDSNNPVSSHYIVGRDGIIVQCVQEKDGAWGNGIVGVGHDPWWSADGNPNPNNITISIEHCKVQTDNSDTLTQAQQDASFALIADICKRNGIPPRLADEQGGITGHFSIDPVNRSRCPGNFPWTALWAYLLGEEIMTIDLSNPIVANFFKGYSSGWLCTNGNFIANAMLAYYQQFGGKDLCGLTHLGLPLTNEIGFGGGRTYQRFERAVLIYDPNHTYDQPPGLGTDEPVYIAHINSGAGEDPRVAALQAQINNLEGQLNGNSQAQQILALQGKIAAAQKALA